MRFPKIGDVVESTTLPGDPGTVTKILESNKKGPSIVEVKWFSWQGGRSSEEFTWDLKIVSEA
tara:strand:+ start:535 stop:723 length:189 start_codon:yes stop_codon:yes gene_type:complete